MRFGFATIILMGLVSACGGEQRSDEPANTTVALQDMDASPVANGSEAAALPTDGWIGKWTGVEGLALDIAKGSGPGAYRLTLDLLDSHNVYEGEADGSVIRFRRGDVVETIRQVPGSETGLKWLADKPNCLMIKPGEGFCRPA
ncbi:hypothetical protein [Flavisphingomonas formosensis]|uniref:hypothetical protein n=1 Tax=Flavisphingomonas formosensis TaxID=861534 RepID=UPI0012F7A84B|nr:hypothetical protein [Sphingomonas formosensis]